MWVLGQAFINIGYVIGVLPVTGLQLPLISAGGTSTAATLFMIGIIANAARHEPEAVAVLRAGRDDKVNRLLRLPLPQPYVPTRLEAFRDRKRTRPQPGKAAQRRNAARKAPQGPVRKASRNSDPPLRPAFPRTAAPLTSRSGGTARLRGRHHGSGQGYTGQRQPRRARALEGQRYG
jgi:cell division protein FtsW